MRKTFKAKSSKEGFYEVTFELENGAFSVHCPCKAGIFGQLCRHKLGLIQGNLKILEDKSQEGDLAELRSHENFKEILAALRSYQSEIVSAEIELSRAKENVKAIKQKFANLLNRSNGGFVLGMNFPRESKEPT